MNGAMTLHGPKGKPIEFSVIREGLLACMISVEAIPLANLKVLYGTGARKLDEKTGELKRVGGALEAATDKTGAGK